MTPEELKFQVEKLLEENRIEESIKLLSKYSKGKLFEDKLTLISLRFDELEYENNLLLKTTVEYQIGRIQIVKSLLTLINSSSFLSTNISDTSTIIIPPPPPTYQDARVDRLTSAFILLIMFIPIIIIFFPKINIYIDEINNFREPTHDITIVKKLEKETISKLQEIDKEHEKVKGELSVAMSSDPREYARLLQEERKLSLKKSALEHKLLTLKVPSIKKIPKNDYTNGKIAYEIPDTMLIDDVARVALVLSDTAKTIIQLKRTIKGLVESVNSSVILDDVEVKTIDISANMIAKLTCSQNSVKKVIEITPLGKERQNLNLRKDYTANWQWDVIPLKEGKIPLNLQIFAQIETDANTKDTLNINVCTEKVLVTSVSSYTITQIIGISLFLLLILSSLYFFVFKRHKNPLVTPGIYLESDKITQAKQYLREGQVSEAIELIKTNTENLTYKLSLQLDTNLIEYDRVDSDEHSGIIAYITSNLIKNRITRSILRVVYKIEKSSKAIDKGNM